jgi:integrase/recombinase XerD
MSTQWTMGSLLHGFFEDYLKLQKGVSPNTIKSYRDAVRLFLQFLSRETGCRITELNLDHLTYEQVSRFLDSLEAERGNHVRSRNQRLASLRAFFEYVGRQLPERLVQAERVVSMPAKRTPPPTTPHLERDEVEQVLANLPKTGRNALRDRALLLFLYNTGARVQEAAELRISNLEFAPHPRVHLHGKGNKWRVCPLWPQTSALLQALIAEHYQPNIDGPLFHSRGRAMTRFGIYKLVRRHTKGLIDQPSRSTHRNISPHVFRHSAAFGLLESGVDINVIRSWLGHVSLQTTNRYAEISIRAKEAALKACEPPRGSSLEPAARGVWQDDAKLLNWLQSL